MREFDREVYDLVREIPQGHVATYGQVARLIGMPNHARRVGRALSAAPPEEGIPCHRVVKSGGGLADGWPGQRQLLEAEGVHFRMSGRVDLRRSTWAAAADIVEK